jgi:hypothetical protein
LGSALFGRLRACPLGLWYTATPCSWTTMIMTMTKTTMHQARTTTTRILRAPVPLLEEDRDACKACLLHAVVQRIEDHGLREFVQLPEENAKALAMFEDVELQAQTFFVSRLDVSERGFSKEDPPICTRCLWWYLTAHFLWRNRNRWTGCGYCSFIQMSPCNDLSVLTPSGPYSVANHCRCCRNSCPQSLSFDKSSSS